MKVINLLEEGSLAGPHYRVVKIAKNLVPSVETIVFMPKANSTEYQELCNKYDLRYRKVHLTTLSSKPLWFMRYCLFFIPELILLIGALKNEKADLIHVSGGAWQIKGVIAAKLCGMTCVWHLNDSHMPSPVRYFFKHINALANGFIFASERTRRYYSPLIKNTKQSSVIQSPVDTFDFRPTQFTKDDCKLTKLKVITVGNISPVKGLELVLEIAKLTSDFAEFEICGPVYTRQESYFKTLKKFIKENGIVNVTFLGTTLNIKPKLADADIYLCTSKFESSPTAVWEAMSMSKPIVSTNVGDVGYFIEKYKCGKIIENRNPKLFANELRKIFSDTKKMYCMKLATRVAAVENFEVAVQAKKYLHFYRQVIDDEK